MCPAEPASSRTRIAEASSRKVAVALTQRPNVTAERSKRPDRNQYTNIRAKVGEGVSLFPLNSGTGTLRLLPHPPFPNLHADPFPLPPKFPSFSRHQCLTFHLQRPLLFAPWETQWHGCPVSWSLPREKGQKENWTEWATQAGSCV